MKVFSDDQVGAMHEAALTMLETQGMKVLSADARVRYANAGALVDETTQMVRLDRGLVSAALATTPHEVTLHAVDPGRHVPLSDGCVAFAPTSGPPNIMDTARGRRAGTFEDFCNLIKLCQSFEVIHVLGGATEPQDVPVNVPPSARHARAAHADATRSRSSSRAATARSPTTSSSSAWRTASRPRSSARGRTCTPSSTPIRRCSSTCRWRTASSISPWRGRC